MKIEFVNHQHGPFPPDIDPDETVVAQFEADHLRLAVPSATWGPFFILVTPEAYHTGWIENGHKKTIDTALLAAGLEALVERAPVRMFAMGYHLPAMHHSVLATAHADGRCGTCTLSHNNVLTGDAAGSDQLNVDVVAVGKIFWGPAWVGLCPCGGPFDSTEGHLPTYDNED